MSGSKKKAVVVGQTREESIKKIAEKLKKRRKELGYSSHETFSYEVGINRSQYGKYEAGNQDMNVGTLIKIVNLMGMTIEEFFNPDYEKK